MNVQPVGTWRFLTPLDVIQIGDLGRYRCGTSKIDYDWSAIEECTEWIIRGKRMVVVGKHPPKNWEFIRPIDGTVVDIEE